MYWLDSLQLNIFAFIIIMTGLATILWLRRHTNKTEMMLYKFTCRSNVSLHMRWGKTPEGMGAYKKLEQHAKEVLLTLRDTGFRTVTFKSHLLREKSESRLRDFLAAENMNITSLRYVPTPVYHRALINLEMFCTRRKRGKINAISGDIVIKLND